MEETYESVLLVKSEVFVFKIPPRTTNRGYRAADWNLAEPEWTGRMKLVCKGNDVAVKLEDKNSGELFAKCPIEQYPGVAIEPVTDSSRYFVLRIQDDNGRSAFVGIGFTDRSDSFDLNVALQDHFKRVKNSETIEREEQQPKEQLDLSFKEGETIKISMKITKKDGSESTSRPKARTAGGPIGLLPPPPGGVKVAPPPSKLTPTSSPSHKPSSSDTAGNLDLLMGALQTPSTAAASDSSPQGTESWGEFASATGTAQKSAPATSPSTNNANWVQF